MDAIERNILVIKKYRISSPNSIKNKNWPFMINHYSIILISNKFKYRYN
jgi:hypothetical protein